MSNNDELLKMRNDANKAIAGFVTAATASCAVPIPLADAAMLIGEQVTMLATISAIYKLGLSKKTLRALVLGVLGTSGASVVGKTIVSSAFKMIPGMGSVVGGVISATTAAVITLALGKAFIELCEAIKNGELTEKDLENNKGKDYFEQLFKVAKEREESKDMGEEMNEKMLKGLGYMKIIKFCNATKDGKEGLLVWDAGLLNEISFCDAHTKKVESLHTCWNDNEAKEKYEEYADKYGVSADKREEKKEFVKEYKPEGRKIEIREHEKIERMKTKSKETLDIYYDGKVIGFVDIVSDKDNEKSFKTVHIKAEYKEKGIYWNVINILREAYSIKLTKRVKEDIEKVDPVS